MPAWYEAYERADEKAPNDKRRTGWTARLNFSADKRPQIVHLSAPNSTRMQKRTTRDAHEALVPRKPRHAPI